MAVGYGLLQTIRQTEPRSALEYRDAAQDRRLRQNATNLNMQRSQEDMAAMRRQRAVSILNGLRQVVDPERKRELYARLAPVAKQVDPSLDLPDQLDDDYLWALAAGTISPEKQATMEATAAAQEQTIQDRNERAADKAEVAHEKFVNTQTEKMGKQFDSSGVSELLSAVENANRQLAPFTKEGADVPGFGPMAGMLPDFAVSQEGKDLRQAYASVRNSILKARSGGAVTDGEADRLLQELGEGTGMPDAQVITGMANVTGFLRDRIANIQAGYTPEAVQTYQDRGGTVRLERLGTPKAGPAGFIPVEQRVKDQVYDTPKGRMTWTGTGWLPAN